MKAGDILAIFYLPPRQQRIYVLLTELAGTICEASLSLEKYITDQILSDRHLDSLRAVKRRGDKNMDLVWKETIRQFVLPFDPEDIIALAYRLHLSLEMITLIGGKTYLYQAFIREEKELMSIIIVLEKAVGEIYQLVSSLHRIKARRRQMGNKCAMIKAYRDQGQLNYLQGTADLYRQKNLPPLQVMVQLEIYRAARESLDCCHDVSLVIREMLIKYV